MAKRNLGRLLELVGLVVLTFSTLGAASYAPQVGSTTAAIGTMRSTPSGTPTAQVTISINGKVGASKTVAAHTSSSGPKVPTPNSYPVDPCLEVFIFTMNAVNTNEASLTGEVYNNCGFTIKSGRTDFFGYEQCAGTSINDSDYASWLTLYPGNVMSYTAYLTGLCEVCDNGKAVDWPPFTLVVQVDASGTGTNNQTVEQKDTAEKSGVARVAGRV